MTWLDSSLGFVVVILVLFGVASLGMPSHRRQQLKLAEIKSRSGEEYKALNEQHTALATETRATQASMQADIAAIRASVESIEQMMRDVG
jgi:hypothetical protein